MFSCQKSHATGKCQLERRAERERAHLTELKLFEVSPVLLADRSKC